MTNQLNELKEIFKEQLAWYRKHRHDQDYVYDCAFDEFNNASRGTFQRLLQILDEV